VLTNVTDELNRLKIAVDLGLFQRAGGGDVDQGGSR
jgi:hypothetical protein